MSIFELSHNKKYSVTVELPVETDTQYASVLTITFDVPEEFGIASSDAIQAKLTDAYVEAIRMARCIIRHHFPNGVEELAEEESTEDMFTSDELLKEANERLDELQTAVYKSSTNLPELEKLLSDSKATRTRINDFLRSS